MLTEHSNFGIRSVAFSPDSRWLCSLGNINDGFIFLWSISKNGSAVCDFGFPLPFSHVYGVISFNDRTIYKANAIQH